MKHFLLFFLCWLAIAPAYCQNIFAQSEIEYKKTLFSFDVKYAFSLGQDNESIVLMQDKKSAHLIRYDKYMFEKWRTDISFDKKEAQQQLILKGDTALVLTYNLNERKNTVSLGIRMYLIEDGSEISNERLLLLENYKEEDKMPPLVFSQNGKYFLFYNFTMDGNEDKAALSLYETGNTDPIQTDFLDVAYFNENKNFDALVENNGNYVIASIDMANFKANYAYKDITKDGFSIAQDVYSFNRPIELAQAIDITPYDSGNYYISFSGFIEDELAGFHIAGFESTTGNIRFSQSENVNKDFISELYGDYYTVGDKSKKKYLKQPSDLEFYRLTNGFLNDSNQLILIFEDLEIPSYYHDTFVPFSMLRKEKRRSDNYFEGGDMLVFCYNKTGEKLWQKTIQKYQNTLNNAGALSYVPNYDGKNLQLLTWETSNKGSFYITTLNTLEGSFEEKTKLLGKKMYDFTKSYSCWLNKSTLLLSTIEVSNPSKRTILMVEL